MTDAVDAYLRHLRQTASPAGCRACGWLLRFVADLVGPYRVLVDIDDEELDAALSVLCEVAPPARAVNARDLLAAWSRWCRSAALPAPAPILTPERGPHLRVAPEPSDVDYRAAQVSAAIRR